mmetsp:Transcript_4597/g.8801  ORF Transcript_4597/g.8801 Transcript_4597/m.8801 type:complete len:202 (+) Transcript_4597:16-621(+)
MAPSDEELKSALTSVKAKNPGQGWKKVIAQVNTENGWEVDLNRGKTMMKACNLMVPIPPKKEKVVLPPPVNAASLEEDQKILAEKKSDEEDSHQPRKKQKAASGVVVSDPNPYAADAAEPPKFGQKWSSEQLKAAIVECKELHPDYGVGRVFEYLKLQWQSSNAPHMDKKRVKAMMKDLGMVVAAPQHAAASANAMATTDT